jgi:hypothetical protein
MRMPSASARFGSRNTSTTSISCRSGRCARQSALRLANRLRGVLRVARDIKPELEHDASTHGEVHFRPGFAASAPRNSRIRVRPRDNSRSRLCVVRANNVFSTCFATSSVCSDFARTSRTASSASSLTRLSFPATSATSFATALGAFLFPAQRAHQHLAARGVGVAQSHTRIAEDQLAHLVRMRRAAGLDDGQAPVALPGLRQIVEVDPGVRERRDLQRRDAGASGRTSRRPGWCRPEWCRRTSTSRSTVPPRHARSTHWRNWTRWTPDRSPDNGLHAPSRTS